MDSMPPASFLVNAVIEVEVEPSWKASSDPSSPDPFIRWSNKCGMSTRGKGSATVQVRGTFRGTRTPLCTHRVPRPWVILKRVLSHDEAWIGRANWFSFFLLGGFVGAILISIWVLYDRMDHGWMHSSRPIKSWLINSIIVPWAQYIQRARNRFVNTLGTTKEMMETFESPLHSSFLFFIYLLNWHQRWLPS